MSDSNQVRFQEIRQMLCAEVDDITTGKMMASEGIMYKKKIIAFLDKSGDMVFELGREFQPEAHNIADYSHLSPFKNKAPMLDWFVIPDNVHWEALTRQALARMQADLDK